MKRILLAAAIAIPALGSVPTSAGPGSDPDSAIQHVLNRIAFGARPGDVDRVKAMGLRRYIDEQLRPDRIDDGQMSGRLEGLTTLRLSSSDIQAQFERPLMEARQERKQDQKDGQNGQLSPEMRALQQNAQRVILELGEQKLLRAVYSERQLQEVLTDFWFNHFNVDARKGRERTFITEYERDVIRPHVLGSFRDLLGATAKSPAMLFYLDNWMSADPNGPHMDAFPQFGRGRSGITRPRMPRLPPPNAKNARKGLNENYARELMELHTLGVDGGYTQKDVTEVARAFTGWTIQQPRLGGGFTFDARVHDPGEKVVLGRVIKAGGGASDGEQVLDLLAKHPSTARFIATKLVRRFVSDTPPSSLVDHAADRFRKTD